MKISLKSLARTAVRAAKKNPEIALGVVGLVAPKILRKAAPIVPIIVAATVKR